MFCACATPTAVWNPTQIIQRYDEGRKVRYIPNRMRIGIHCHNDIGCAVANSLLAVDAGARYMCRGRLMASASGAATRIFLLSSPVCN